jgi:hypothetical protein
MPKLDAMFEENYIYGTGEGNLGHGLNVYFTDIFGKYTITPVKNNGSSGFHYAVDINYTYSYKSEHLKMIHLFKSKKKAMQYVVAELFTELFDYEQYFNKLKN